MTARVTFRQVDVARMIRGALQAGLGPGDFEIAVEGGKLRLLPTTPDSAPSEADEMERRMREAFGA